MSDARIELEAELDLARQLYHPGLIRPIEAELDGNFPYAIYEHLDGEALPELLADPQQRPEPKQVLRIGYELARTLSYIHLRDHVHAGLRPDVVMVSPQGVIVRDLKTAVPVGCHPVRPHQRGGQGDATVTSAHNPSAQPSADVFALGVVLYQSLLGSPDAPFETSRRRRYAALGFSTNGRERPLPSGQGWRRLPGELRGVIRPSRPSRSATTLIETAERAETLALLGIIDQLTATNPGDRPTAEETLALIRPLLFPAPLAPAAIPRSNQSLAPYPVAS